MKNSSRLLIIFNALLTVTFLSTPSFAQILIEEGQGTSTMPSTAPVVQQDEQKTEPPSIEKRVPGESGENAARQYFIERKQRGTSMGAERKPSSESDGPRYMAIQIGTFITDKQYRWGSKDRADDVGEMIVGMSYRMGQWTNSMDLLLRTEFITYDIDGETPKKLSVMPVITFPDAGSNFPVYFGAGAGVGVFFDQVGDESDLSADYQLLVGARFMNLWESGGLVFESGLKGHVHLVSSGQFNGVFLTMGAAFTF